MHCQIVLVFMTIDEQMTSFLIVTNILLGLLVLGCCALVFWGLLREIAFCKRARLRTLSKAAVTMADGGKRIDERSRMFVGKDGILQQTQSGDSSDSRQS
jgi:hypothetical protein